MDIDADGFMVTRLVSKQVPVADDEVSDPAPLDHGAQKAVWGDGRAAKAEPSFLAPTEAAPKPKKRGAAKKSKQATISSFFGA
jgi:hypothetical protein